MSCSFCHECKAADIYHFAVHGVAANVYYMNQEDYKMGVFRRLSDLLKSNVNDLIDRAEDPEKMVKQVIIDMQTELTKATQNYGKAKASERLAEKKYREAEKISADWESKAKAALSKGDQELAKQALARKVKADEDVANYKEMYESISDQTEAIGNQVEVLKAKLEEAKSRQAMLIARSQMADTKKNAAADKGSFSKGVKAEWGKIVWTDKKSLIRQTIAVVIISVLICLLITLADSLGLQIMDLLMK